jgi:Alpha/beta hydrolase domain
MTVGRTISRAAGLLLVMVAIVTLSAGITAVQAATGTGPDVTGPVTGGKGIQALGISYEFKSVGYELQEYFLGGTATSYTPKGTFATDGKWTVEAGETAPYKTRVLVVKPTDPKQFNGTVYVEWLNVTGGVDAGATFLMGHNYILRSGAAWVGVTAQSVGVNGGGTNAVQSSTIDIPQGGLRASDPDRYSSLVHPGDRFSYDMMSQAAAAVRGDGTGVKPLEGMKVKRVYAMGESQSAGRLTTYVNAVQPVSHAFDAFLIHSRGSTPAPLGERVAGVTDTTIPVGARIRTDLEVPVFTFETEYDVVGGYADARQPNTKKFRAWEVAGTSHIDSYTGSGASLTDLGDGKAELTVLDPTKAAGGLLSCTKPMNAGAQEAPLMAAMSHLDAWVRTGKAPPQFPRLDTSGTGTSIQVARDDLGIARGGVRTPIVDAPLAVNVGDTSNTPAFCSVFGYSTPLDATTLAKLYPKGDADYRMQFNRQVDKAVKAGIWLPAEAKNFKAAAAQLQIG